MKRQNTWLKCPSLRTCRDRCRALDSCADGEETVQETINISRGWPAISKPSLLNLRSLRQATKFAGCLCTDENGKAVHDECYDKRITTRQAILLQLRKYVVKSQALDWNLTCFVPFVWREKQ